MTQKTSSHSHGWCLARRGRVGRGWSTPHDIIGQKRGCVVQGSCKATCDFHVWRVSLFLSALMTNFYGCMATHTTLRYGDAALLPRNYGDATGGSLKGAHLGCFSSGSFLCPAGLGSAFGRRCGVIPAFFFGFGSFESRIYSILDCPIVGLCASPGSWAGGILHSRRVLFCGVVCSV